MQFVCVVCKATGRGAGDAGKGGRPAFQARTLHLEALLRQLRVAETKLPEARILVREEPFEDYRALLKQLVDIKVALQDSGRQCSILRRNYRVT